MFSDLYLAKQFCVDMPDIFSSFSLGNQQLQIIYLDDNYSLMVNFSFRSLYWYDDSKKLLLRNGAL